MFHSFSSVFNIDFEQVNVSWVDDDNCSNTLNSEKKKSPNIESFMEQSIPKYLGPYTA